MASKLFFDPLAALAVAPLVSSTCTLWFAFDQSYFLSVFNSPTNRPKSDAILPTWFKEWFAIGVPRVVGLLAATFWGSMGNYYWRYDSLVGTESVKWYVAGGALAVSHLLFVPLIAPRVQKLVERKESPTNMLDEWLRIHCVRTWTVDLAAWACFVVGVLRQVNV